MARHFSHEDMLAFGQLLDVFDRPERYGLKIERSNPEADQDQAVAIIAEARSRLEDLKNRGIAD